MLSVPKRANDAMHVSMLEGKTPRSFFIPGSQERVFTTHTDDKTFTHLTFSKLSVKQLDSLNCEGAGDVTCLMIMT